MHDEVKNIPIQDIVEPTILMRLVDTGSLDYLEMYYSMQDVGFLNSVSVRPSKKTPGKYELIDGLWRYTVARHLKLEMVPCIVKNIDEDTDVLFLQIAANAIRPVTKPCEYAEHLDRILKSDPEMTLVTLAGRLKKELLWIRETLNLNRLLPVIKKSVNRGEIPVKSARLLSKIPQSWQEQFFSQAKLLTYQDFSPLARRAIKDFKEAKRQGTMKRFYETQYTPHPYLRTMRDLVNEMEHCEEGAMYLVNEDWTPIEAWQKAVQWCLHMDPKGVKEQTRRYAGMLDKPKIDAKRRRIDRRKLQELENCGFDLTNQEK